MKWKLGVELENHLKRNGNQHIKAPLSNKAHKWILFVYLLSPNSYKIELEPRDRDSSCVGKGNGTCQKIVYTFPKNNVPKYIISTTFMYKIMHVSQACTDCYLVCY